MKDNIVNILKNLKKAHRDIATSCYSAFDELILYSLERRHLDVPEYSNILLSNPEREGELDLNNHLQQNVRLFKLDEIAFDSDNKIHLPNVESALASMRNQGHSLLFIVQGDATRTCIYMGISKIVSGALETSAVLDGYEAVWRANFPGSRMEDISVNDISKVAYEIGKCTEFGVLTGIPSLKREEESQLFVQGLERLIRAMRGKTYCWVSIADPLPQDAVRDAISACQQLESDIHHFVTTNLSKATSNGKTVMLGMFGMQGQGDTGGGAHTDSSSEAVSTSHTDMTSQATSDGTSTNQNHLEVHQRISGGVEAVAPIIGGAIGSIFPGVGTVLGAGIGLLGGKIAGGLINGVGGAITGKNGWSSGTSHSQTTTTSSSDTITNTSTTGVADTQSWARTMQQALGGFGSFGLTWTKTTTVGEELLNRKAEYAEEVLRAYEKRLHEGTALGMWNLGHYFCAADADTYRQGIGVVNSLFTGMDSTYEPPRAIKVPQQFGDTLRRFQNVYLRFADHPVSKDELKAGKVAFQDHPLGCLFNGPATPVNTRELAIATPIATQDVEGVSVSRRPSFGINLNTGLEARTKTLTVGRILDKGNQTTQSYRMLQSNLPKHLAVFGLTGSGKTNTVHHLLRQLWKNEHIPFLVIEPAKAEYRALATMDEFKDDLLVISAGIDRTTACPLRLNPFDFEPGSDTDANRVHVLTHIDRLKATFNASFPMYASMPYILEEAILEVYQERGWNLGRSENRFVDIYSHDFRDYLPTLRDLYWKVDDVVKRKGYFQEQQMNIQAALKARLSSLLVGAKGTMLDTPRSLPASDLFERPVVIELENLGDDDEKAFLMGLLVSRLYEWRKATFINDLNRPIRHMLVVEEAHRLLANIPDTSTNMEVGNSRGKAVASFVDMLSEIRSYGEGVIVVDQLPSRVSPNIVKGTGAKIIHRLLANDDRESVGGTMGLSDEQIADMSLLRTGECIVSQDGDLKAFQVLVPKNEVHEKRTGGEISSATEEYRQKHVEYLTTPSSDIDLEDGIFKDSLYKMMLAVGIGQTSRTLMNLRPTRPCGEWHERLDWFSIYWKQVCSEIWSAHGGSWAAWLALKNTGAELLQNGGRSEVVYREKYKDYFSQSRLYASSVTGELVGVAFEPFLVNGKSSMLEIINKNWDVIQGTINRAERLAQAIRRALPLLEPKGSHFDKIIRCALVTEIVNRINPILTTEVLAEFQKGEV